MGLKGSNRVAEGEREMKCPACQRALVEFAAGPMRVDICLEGCAGIWFDRDELTKVDDFNEPFPESLIRVLSNAQVAIDKRRERECPRCVGQVMTHRFLDDQLKVQADECSSCGGHFLDIGELSNLRDESRRDAESQRLWSDWLKSHGDNLKDPEKGKRYRAFFEVLFK